MTIEMQKYLLNLLKKMIDDYKKQNLIKDQEKCLNSINSFAITFDFVLGYLYSDFIKQIEHLLITENLTRKLEEYNHTKDVEYINFCNKQDYNYIKYLINKISLESNESNKVLETDTSYIVDYICVNDNFLQKYYQDEKNIIYENSFLSCASLPLYFGKNIILTNTLDITALYHEFLHGIYIDKINIYCEANNILGELALQRQYNIGSSINRLELISISKHNKFLGYNPFVYLIGTLLAYPIVNKYGSDFNTTYYFMNLIYKNNKLDFHDMLKLCNIHERDIIKSFKNK